MCDMAKAPETTAASTQYQIVLSQEHSGVLLYWQMYKSCAPKVPVWALLTGESAPVSGALMFTATLTEKGPVPNPLSLSASMILNQYKQTKSVTTA